MVIRRMKDGRTFVLTRPGFSNSVFSKDQLTHQSRFQKATAYAREASKTNPLYAQLARSRSQTAYTLALSDWFHAPVIHEIQRQDGCVHVVASDNVQVTKVLITILDEEGNTVEHRQAASPYGFNWEYATSTEGNIIVEAFDLAGNCTKHEA